MCTGQSCHKSFFSCFFVMFFCVKGVLAPSWCLRPEKEGNIPPKKECPIGHTRAHTGTHRHTRAHTGTPGHLGLLGIRTFGLPGIQAPGDARVHRARPRGGEREEEEGEKRRRANQRRRAEQSGKGEQTSNNEQRRRWWQQQSRHPSIWAPGHRGKIPQTQFQPRTRRAALTGRRKTNPSRRGKSNSKCKKAFPTLAKIPPKKEGQRDQPQKRGTDFSELQKNTKDFSIEKLAHGAEDGVKYFRDTLRPISSRELKVFSSGVFLLFEQGEENAEMVDWIGKFSLLLKRLQDAWMDLLPLPAMNQQQRESQYHADMTHLNAERRNRKLRRPCTLMNKRPETNGTQHMWLPTEAYFHSMITRQHLLSLLQVI